MTTCYRRGRVLAAATGGLACLVAVLASCSSSSSKTTTSTVASPSSSSPTAPPSASPASQSELAKIVLQPSDLPAGWTSTPYQVDPNEAAELAALMRCLGLPNTASDKVAEANSDDFHLGDASVSSSASSYRSQSAVDSNVAALHSSKFSSCLAQQLKQLIAPQLPAGAAIESVSVKVTPGSAGGPANVVGTGAVTMKISLGGQQAALYLTVAYIIGPLIQADVDSQNTGAPVPASLMDSLVAAVANRAAQA